ncbi:uncharacterized protein KD926_011182 [Aspergillus affinis]|uniref:uncharacterized protein n=1 Tax=Aspergillus affinis TaxID=1070780 RepID=UPI0022FDF40C|nr:uncharacterized protein KD926_011182 [Aspergillus affinis]KAI9038243.1 hypothetical protein KD926_011182 [Aspergillus affinis]
MKVVVEAASSAVEKWEAWRESKGTEADQAKTSMVLDERLSKTSLSDDNLAVTIADRDPVLKEEGGVKITVSERIKQVEIISIEEISPTELETWSEKLTEEPKFIPSGPVVKETAIELSLTTKALRGLSIALGAGVAAAMTFSLVHDWKDLTTACKVINTLSVVVQILAVLVEGVSLLVDVGLIASSVLTAVPPIVGVVLALAGVVLMILSVCGIQLYKEPPTPNPVKDFIDDTVTKLIKDWPSPPIPQLTYQTDKPSFKEGDTSLTITATNKTAEEIDPIYAQITVYSGGTSNCLFTEGSFNKINPEGKSDGTVTVTPGKDKFDNSLLPHRVEDDPAAFVFNLLLKGLKGKGNPEAYLKLKANEKIDSTWKGHASHKGGSSIIEIVEVMKNMDKTHKLLTVLKSS